MRQVLDTWERAPRRGPTPNKQLGKGAQRHSGEAQGLLRRWAVDTQRAGPGRWTRKGVQGGREAGTKARKCELIGRCVSKRTSRDAARPCFSGSGDIGKTQERLLLELLTVELGR